MEKYITCDLYTIALISRKNYKFIFFVIDYSTTTQNTHERERERQKKRERKRYR